MAESITTQDAEYALELVKKICREVGPGLPASPQERQRAQIIKKELEAHLGAGNVVNEEFTLSPGAFLGGQLISTIFLVIAVLLNISIERFSGSSPWLISLAALVFSFSGLLLFILEFVIGNELIDPFFEKRESVNVIGTLRKPGTTNVKRLLILSGHHDSALEFTWIRFTGYGYYFLAATWLIAFLTMMVMSLIQLAGMITGNAALVHTGTLGWVLLLYPMLTSVIFVLFYARGRKNGGTVPGAADNLSACALAVAMCRFLVKNPAYIPDETEIRFITFGCEEAGVRGSRRYVKGHLDELKRLDARLLNFETITDPEIAILTSETNGSVKNSPEAIKSAIAAAERAGIPYKLQPATLGTGSDAGPFSRAGLKATTLLGFTMKQSVSFYHQERDTPEILSIEPLVNVLKLTFEWIRSGGDTQPSV